MVQGAIKGKDHSTTTPKSKLGDGPTGQMEAETATSTMEWMMVRGNRIKNG